MAASNLTPIERFFAKVERIPECGCWLFVGTLNNKGYGQFSVNENGKWKNVLAHRYSYQMLIGPPSGFEVMHLCDTPSCCNPNHLRLGTHSENMQDCARKGRANTPRNRPTFPNGYKTKGQYKTRPAKISAAQRIEMQKLKSEGMKSKDLAEMFGVHKHYVAKLLRVERAEDRLLSPSSPTS